MAVASQAVALATAPETGEYFRMEENHTQRFKNRMKLQLLGRIAVLEVPGSKPKKPPRIVTLEKVTEDSLIINWPEVIPDWPCARLQKAACGDVEGILEDETHFWKLYKRYSSSDVAALISQYQTPSLELQLEDDVAALISQQQTPSPLLPLEDVIRASATEPSSSHDQVAHCSTEEVILISEAVAQPRVRPLVWLDAPISGRERAEEHLA